MKKLILLFLLSISSTAFANNLNSEQQEQVQHIINLFKKHDIDAISQSISYPLQRQSPIPSIENAAMMKNRYSQVFDAQLSQTIANSKLSQWSSMGYRGVMLDSGLVWLDGPEIRAVNHMSPAEQQYKKNILAQQKQMLHPTLKQFKDVALQFKTEKYQVRIDQLSNGNYRYAAWAASKAQSSKPDLILNNGSVTMDGSGGNHFYRFKNGAYQYTVYRFILGAEDIDVELVVEKNSKEILKQAGEILPWVILKSNQ